ncbi:MAG: carboxypeptidase-like regulatory domain-containing protein, partial [Chitinophagales bacterium]
MKQLLTILCILLMLPFAANAQTVSGKVMDTDGEALVGATIVVDGTTTGTTTDVDGNYSLKVGAGTHKLNASFIGFQTQTKVVTLADGQ